MAPYVRGSAFAEEDDSVGVGAFRHVVHAPAIGCFCEFLIVDEHEERFKPCRYAAGKDDLLEFRFPGMDFTNLESDVPARLQHAVQLLKNLGHGRPPGGEL